MALKWESKAKSYNSLLLDCRLSLSTTNNQAVINISASALATKFHNKKYMLFAISGDRLYLQSTEQDAGWKISRTSDTSPGRLQIIDKKLAEFIHNHPWRRDANFLYDKTEDAYYVDMSKRNIDWKENR